MMLRKNNISKFRRITFFQNSIGNLKNNDILYIPLALVLITVVLITFPLGN
jgi:hypothetical protein